MDGGSRDSNPQTTSEDEANKRNTDCVYFLASPLTCIKGADCEYRHSENARVNPRDCWFWLNGNCLNPKCAFRHPPLDGFRGVSTDASLGASLPPSQPAIPAQAPHYASTPYHAASYTSSKQKVPCYYFQKGLCLKGDKCPFMHGSQPAGDPTLVQTSKTDPVSDPQSDKKTMNGTENPTSQKRNTPQSFASRAAEAAPITKTDGKKGALPSVGNTFQKNRTPANVVDKPIRFTQAAVVVPSRNASAKPRLRPSQSQDERFQNGKDVDECLGESSPGFDVLVDDDLEEEYFDADMERAPGHGGRHLNSQQEIDRVGSGTDTFGEFVGEHEKLEPYDIYGRKQDQFGWEQSRAPAERVLERSSMTERRVLSREEIPAQKKEQDLRHQLSKRRRVNESRAVNGSNNHGDLYRKDDQFVEDRYRRHSRQENLQHASTEGSLSKRLHGRIKFPERPPEFSSEPYSDVELEQRKMRGRSSPSRAGLHLGKNCEKVRGRTDEDIATEGGSFRGQAARSEERKLESLDFAGPKSLAQLKGAKISETHEEQNVVSSANRQPLKSQVVHGEGEKRMRPRKCSIQDSSVSLSFEGPKPLSELLKRKRETSSGHNGEPRKEENQMERTHGNSDVTDLQTPVAKSAERKKEAADGSSRSPISAGTDPDKLDSTDEVHPFTNDGSPTEADCNAQEEEDALMLDTEDQVEGNLEKDRESEDAGIEENLDAEDEYEDDEDGDDFARKLGVMFS